MNARMAGFASLLAGLVVAGAAAVAGAPDPAPGAVLADLPFEPYLEVNRVIVDLAPDGQKPFRLTLDTGARPRRY